MKAYKSIELVCHNGHVIMESAYDCERATFEESKKVTLEFARTSLEPFCKLCGSPTFSVREKQTQATDLGSLGKRFFGEQVQAIEQHKKTLKEN